MKKKPERERVWKGCISLPPDVHAFLKTRPVNRSAAITAAVRSWGVYRRWVRKMEGKK